jgi:hypothetical protein
MRRIAAAIGVAACLAANLATAETVSEAFSAFGLVGAWSPDCTGPIRVIYATQPDGAASVSVVIERREIAASDIQSIVRLGVAQIKWISIMRKWSLPDQPQQPWMPESGEIWETVIEKLGPKIRPLQSIRQDGQKILVKDGFIYDPDKSATGGWRNTQKATIALERCG